MKGIRRSWLSVLIGVPLGLGIFTLDEGEGLSYFSKDPNACANCHIMEPQFDSWQKSSHHTVATCVDCHLPHDGVEKYLAKAENGWNHSKGFTLQNFPEPIMITEKNRALLRQNCRSCHQDFMHDTLSASGRTEELNCIHCHRDVGHGETAGLGGPWDEIEARILPPKGAPHDP